MSVKDESDGGLSRALELELGLFLTAGNGEEAIDAEVIQQTAQPPTGWSSFRFLFFSPLLFLTSLLVMYFVFVFFYCFTVMKKCGVWDEEFFI